MLVTSTTKTVLTEKKIAKITIDDDSMFISVDLVYRDKYEDNHIINERRYTQTFSGPSMLELAGVAPRIEVPNGLNYYEAVRDRCYAYLTEKNMWPE